LSSSLEILRYEALLDQGFDHDLILRQKLKEMASAPALDDARPPKTGGNIV